MEDLRRQLQEMQATHVPATKIREEQARLESLKYTPHLSLTSSPFLVSLAPLTLSILCVASHPHLLPLFMFPLPPIPFPFLLVSSSH